jgi:hypothetical protein
VDWMGMIVNYAYSSIDDKDSARCHPLVTDLWHGFDFVLLGIEALLDLSFVRSFVRSFARSLPYSLGFIV